MKKNIVLIGMPGSGKTTLGRLLSKHLKMSFIDLDEEIEKYTQQTIPKLFEKGETHFRDIESEVTKTISKRTHLVIATGGGIVLREENMKALHKNGVIVFLNRPLEKIAGDVEMDTRPLLKDGLDKLQNLYNERIALYQQYADIIIENNESHELAVEKIIDQLAVRKDNEDEISYNKRP